MTDVNQLITEHLDIWTSAIEKKSSAGRGNGGISLYGIKKLRDLILELAVQGKLVPQDPLDWEGPNPPKRQHKPRKNDAVDARALAFKPPENWVEAKFEDFFSLDYGDNLPDRKRSQTGEIAVYGSNGVVGTHHSASVNSPCIVVGRKGSAGALNLCLDDACWVTDVAYSSIPPEGVDIHYALILFSTLGLDALGKGIKPGLSRKEAYVLPIALPPIAEQRRIVAKVNELMGLCDTLEAQAEDSLKAHEALVQTCLAALTNSQTPEDLAQNWARIEVNFDALFTTEESIHLLEDAVQELAVSGQLVEQDPNESRANQALLRPDGSAEKFDLGAFEARSKLFPLPEGWTIEPLSRVSSHIVDCPHTTPKWTDEGELCIKSEQIFAGQIDLSKPKYVSHETYIERIERLTPLSDDMLYKREGGILGVGSRIPPDTKVCLGQRLMLIRAGEAVRPDYLELVINSPWTRRFAAEKTTGGAAPRVNMTVVRAYPIPVPPLQEQARIIERVRQLSDLCRKMRTDVQIERKLRTALADTLVEKAA